MLGTLTTVEEKLEGQSMFIALLLIQNFSPRKLTEASILVKGQGATF